MQQKYIYIPRCISHVSLSLSLTRSLILGLYMFVHISMMNIIVSFFHFFTLSREFFHCWNSSFLLLLRHLLFFFCYKRWNFSSIEITAAAAAFFAGREKRNFLFPFIVWCVFVMRMMMRRQKKLLLHLILIHHRGKCDSVSGDGRQCSLNPMLPSGRLHIFSYC